MSQTNSFIVLNASAGSGKTYSLVKQYLTTLLKSNNPNKFRHLLAITFTNKAVAEMKNRVLKTLTDIAYYTDDTKKPDMFDDLRVSSNLNEETLVRKSREILNRILHNYAAFDVVTIDTLTHRIIRTFARDLDIASNFEVSLDQKMLNTRAVNALVAQVGIDDQITRVLIDFAIEKADDDKSWDVTRDLLEIANLLHNENDLRALTILKNTTLSDFENLAKHLNSKISILSSQQQKIGQNLIDLIHDLGLDQKSFASGYFYKFILQVAQGTQGLSYSGAAYKDQIEEYAFYTKGQKEEIKAIIDQHKVHFVETFLQLKKLALQQNKYEAFRSKLIPLSVLHLIKKELDLIKEEENLLLISDFNSLIAKSLRDQPAAFLYERLGERYTNYFIDEFQDTSILQWHNLIPLIDNAISSAPEDVVGNSVLLVGDPKQAIYRWRGGEAEQFISLSNSTNPFTAPAAVERLETNYRSSKEIVNFNNTFFTHLATHFDNQLYQNIYQADNTQNQHSTRNGYVSIEFIEYQKKEEADVYYPERVIEIIADVVAQGYSPSDICILTRSNSHGTHLAAYLQNNDIQVVSSESLLITNSQVVLFIHAFIEMLAFQNQIEKRLPVLYFIAALLNIRDKHSFYTTHTTNTIDEFLENLSHYDIDVNTDYLSSLPLYDYLEYIIQAFDLKSQADAYVIAYLDLAYNYTQSSEGGLLGFIDFWEEKKEKASIVAPNQKEAVQIMSIHKSKGLEFPVVIYPYADSDIYRTRGEHQWFPVEDEAFEGFQTLMVPHNKGLQDFGDIGAALYNQKNDEQQFDAINILYVALTRAVDQLYVLSRFRESVSKINTYNDLFIDFLQKSLRWDHGNRLYTFGNKTNSPLKTEADDMKSFTPSFISTAKEDRGIQIITQAAFLWDSQAQNAITYGNLIHGLMAKVEYNTDVEDVIKAAVREGLVDSKNYQDIRSILSKIVNHDTLQAFYKPPSIIYNERMIISDEGKLHIPDRVVITNKEVAVIIDYKTGNKSSSHLNQINLYGRLYEQMGYMVSKKYLVYLDKDVDVIAV